MGERVVVEVTAFEALPQGDSGSRRALVRWSDGSTGEALRWYDDLCEGPDKSSYADFGVMPGARQDRGWAVGIGLGRSG